MLAVQLSDDLLEQGREKKEEAASTDCDQVCLSGQGQEYGGTNDNAIGNQSQRHREEERVPATESAEHPAVVIEKTAEKRSGAEPGV